MEKIFKILAVNPGSTSTKVAVYENSTPVGEYTIRHSNEELAPYHSVMEQLDFRREVILRTLAEAGVDIAALDIVIGRGGLLKPIPSGVYEVTDAVVADLAGSPKEHASNLGGLLAREIADRAGVKAYIADPVVVDELEDVARVTGLPGMRKVSIFHPLNQKAIARRYAAGEGRRYEDMNLIVAHMGGGISIGAHRRGRVVDVNNALDGEGPFSPERAMSLPMAAFAEMCFSGEYTLAEVKKLIAGKGGLVALLGTNNVSESVKRAESGDDYARLVLDAMSYQTAKSIGAAAAVLCGGVDAIILTGGVAYNPMITDYIARMTRFIAPVVVIPGEDELEALASNALRLLTGEARALDYSSEKLA